MVRLGMFLSLPRLHNGTKMDFTVSWSVLSKSMLYGLASHCVRPYFLQPEAACISHLFVQRVAVSVHGDDGDEIAGFKAPHSFRRAELLEQLNPRELQASG